MCIQEGGVPKPGIVDEIDELFPQTGHQRRDKDMTILAGIIAVGGHEITRPNAIGDIAPQAVIDDQKIEVGQDVMNRGFHQLALLAAAPFP